MPAHDPPLDPDDNTELGEMLEFLHDWFSGTDTELLAASLRRFVGTDGYDLTKLRPTSHASHFSSAPMTAPNCSGPTSTEPTEGDGAQTDDDDWGQNP